MTSSQRVGANLKEWRQRQGLSQEVLGARVNVDAARISKLEKGGENPTLDTVDALAGALAIHPSLLHAPRPDEEDGREQLPGYTAGGGTWLADYLRMQLERPDHPIDAPIWRKRVLHAITTLLDALEHPSAAAAGEQAPGA